MKYIKEKYHTYLVIALLGAIYSFLLYSMMMSQQLTNTFDGLWHQNFHHAGDTETTSGRWMLRFIDKFVMGIHADPVISIITLSLFVLGLVLVLDLFDIRNKIIGFLCITLFTASATISNILSYRFTSFGYSVAFVLAVLAVYILFRVKPRAVSIIVSGILLGLSMACYQAYLGVYCIIAVCYFIYRCANHEEDNKAFAKNILGCILNTIISMFIGAIVYFGSLHFFLNKYNIALSSYNGADSIAINDLLIGMTHNITKTFKYFYSYFFLDTLKINRLADFGVFYLFFALAAVLIVYMIIKTWKKNPLITLLLIICVPLVPIACNAYMLIAGDKLELQMTAGLALVVPLTMILLFSTIKHKSIKIICALFCIVLIYGSSMQVWIDQEAMYEGKNSCETMATQVLNDLQEENLLSADKEYYFIGVPANNDYFSVSDAYYCANAYAQMGNFWVSGSCCQLSYHGLINNLMGFNLPMSPRLYNEFENNQEMMSMPTFPNDGYIAELYDNLVLIKISEYGKYTGNSKY